MVRFIFGCAFIVALSILATPIFYGVSQEKKALETASATSDSTDSSLSFEEIYNLASEGNEPTAEELNNILPAAGGDLEDKFSSGFQGKGNSALTDFVEPITAEEKRAN